MLSELFATIREKSDRAVRTVVILPEVFWFALRVELKKLSKLQAWALGLSVVPVLVGKLIDEKLISFGYIKTMFLTYPFRMSLIFTVFATGLGIAASLWKRRSLKTYAVAEIAFGNTFVFSVFKSLPPDFAFSKLFAIGSAVYVIARGFNNLADVKKANQEDEAEKAMAAGS